MQAVSPEPRAHSPTTTARPPYGSKLLHRIHGARRQHRGAAGARPSALRIAGELDRHLPQIFCHQVGAGEV